MIKKIPRPNLPDARVLTPMEMNNLHFKTLDNHTPLNSYVKSNYSGSHGDQVATAMYKATSANKDWSRE